MRDFEVIQYELFGLSLQEPVSLIYNWLAAVLCLIWYLKLKPENELVRNWRYFFLTFSITCFVAGIAHSLYQYTGIYGKMPHWIGGIVSGYFVGKAMLSLLDDTNIKRGLNLLLKSKLVINLTLALGLVTFTFVLIDSVLTYIVYCAGISLFLIRKGQKDLKLFVYGVITSFSGALCFVLKLDVSRYFNREDFSHVFILASLILFFYGAKKQEQRKELIIE